ncbi:neuromedin-U receptor 2-like [Saccostrea cucullata]|uniref:neuromedin-U receptor 2-like n=1 Tax=Saccostrea cuccullata TaxID=36930 RepID=UPI002ED323E3
MENFTLGKAALNLSLNLTRNVARPPVPYAGVPFSWKLISSIILVTGCIGNILTIFSIFRDKNLKTPTYILIACMAIADLSAIIVRFIILTWNVFLPDVLPNPVEFSLTSAAVGMVVVQSSCLHVVLFAYVRYALLVHPLWSRFAITSVRVVYASLAVWALSFFLGILYGLFGLFITEEFDILVLEIIYISYLIAATMVPIAILHLLKIYHLKKSRTHECTMITKRMTLISGIVIFVQIITMVPVTVKVIVLLAKGFAPDTSDVTDLIVHLMLSVGNSINPVIYFLMSKPQNRHWSRFHLCFS